MSDYLTTDVELTSIADAIREKGGTSAALVYPQGFIDAIEAIPQGVDFPVFTVTVDAYQIVQSITCDKTFAQCKQFLENEGAMGAVVRFHPTYTAEDALYGVYGGYTDYDGTSYALYGPVFIGGALYDIKYRSNGSIELVSPSEWSGEEGTPTATKGAVSNHSIAVTPSVNNGGGYIDGNAITGTPVTISASELVSGTLSISSSGSAIDVTNYSAVNVPAGSAFTPAKTITVNPSFSLNSSTGIITATAAGSSSITPTVNAGYISAGTAGTVSVSGTSTFSLTTQAAQTFYPSTADQTLASARYLTGAQTFKSVVTTNLLASNIAEGVTIKIGDSSDDDRIAAVTGTFAGGGSVASAAIIPTIGDQVYDANDGVPVWRCCLGVATVYTSEGFIETENITADVVLQNNKVYHIKGVYKRLSNGKSYSIDDDFTYRTNVSVEWVEDGTQNTFIAYVKRYSTTAKFKLELHPGDVVDEDRYLWLECIIAEADPIDGFSSVNLNYLSSPFFSTINRRWSGALYYSSYFGSTFLDDRNVIGSFAFAGMPYLMKAYFDGVKQLGNFAFCSTATMTSAHFSSASAFGGSTFQSCVNLKNIYAPNVSTIGWACFQGCANLLSVSFPSLTAIPSYAFSTCNALTGVYLPNVTKIWDCAFYWCRNLSTFDFQNVSEIGSSAFFSCSALLNVTNTSAIQAIRYSAFANCTHLQGFSADNVVNMYSAFMNCREMSYVYFSNLSHITMSAFVSCWALSDVSIPKAMDIGTSAFMWCSALSGVSFPSVSTLGTNAFGMCTALEGISLPAATNIASMAFQSCYNMSYAYLGNSSQALTAGSHAFRYCSNLTDVSIPGISVVTSYMFADCTNLPRLVLPAVTSISNYAFSGCSNLLSLYILTSTVCSLAAAAAFAGTPISNYTTSTGGVHGSIFVPASLYNSYKAATNWKAYSARIVSLTDAQIAALL